jgi:Ca2+-binding EF-hand superfamily protein
MRALSTPLLALLSAAAFAAPPSQFEGMDANRDGKVTAAEMDAAQQTITGRKHEQGSKGMFEKMDKNRDGYLSKQEFDAGHAALTKSASK